MDKNACAAIAEQYLSHIKTDIMPFWDSRCIDRECGGYLTCFDREGNLTDTNKYIWFQGRQLYTYALLYNRIEKNKTWLEYARHGFRFLAEKAYAGNGRWNYKLDRAGNVLEGTISVYADYHVLQGLAEYNKAIGRSDPLAMQILTDTYFTLEKNMFDPMFKDIYENTWTENLIWHDMYMTCLSCVLPCIDLLGYDKCEKLLLECLDKIDKWFYRPEYGCIFESVTRDNQVDVSTVQGRFINPGHTMESVWFHLAAARQLDRPEYIERGLRFLKAAHGRGHDEVYGGLLSYNDACGYEPVAVDWYLETNSLWDDKVWWSNAEALAAYAMAYEATGEMQYKTMFDEQSEFCMQHFFDPENGEWYERLHRNGDVKVSDKGTPWKCAFHLVRALVQVYSAFDRLAKS